MTCPCKTHRDWTTVPPCDLHWLAYFRQFVLRAVERAKCVDS